jgi:hypothetical protein
MCVFKEAVIFQSNDELDAKTGVLEDNDKVIPTRGEYHASGYRGKQYVYNHQRVSRSVHQWSSCVRANHWQRYWGVFTRPEIEPVCVRHRKDRSCYLRAILERLQQHNASPQASGTTQRIKVLAKEPAVHPLAKLQAFPPCQHLHSQGVPEGDEHLPNR